MYLRIPLYFIASLFALVVIIVLIFMLPDFPGDNEYGNPFAQLMSTPDIRVTCSLSGNRFVYDTTITNLVLHLVKDEQADIVPILFSHNLKSRDTENSVIRLVNNEEIPLGELHFKVITNKPPLILKYADRSAGSMRLAKGQSAVVNGYKITLKRLTDDSLIDIPIVNRFAQTCTAYFSAECAAETRYSIKLTKCDDGPCKESFLLCNQPITIEFKGFDAEGKDCDERQVMVFIKTEKKPDPSIFPVDYNYVTVDVWRDSDDKCWEKTLPTGDCANNMLGSYSINITKYDVAGCIKVSQDSPGGGDGDFGGGGFGGAGAGGDF